MRIWYGLVEEFGLIKWINRSTKVFIGRWKFGIWKKWRNRIESTWWGRTINQRRCSNFCIWDQGTMIMLQIIRCLSISCRFSDRNLWWPILSGPRRIRGRKWRIKEWGDPEFNEDEKEISERGIGKTGSNEEKRFYFSKSQVTIWRIGFKWKTMFMKYDISRNKNFMRMKIIEFVSFDTSRISKKNINLSSSRELVWERISKWGSITEATKCFKVIILGFNRKKYFIWWSII